VRKKELWLFLAKLIPLTLLLGYLWFFHWQIKYPFAIGFMAKPFFDLVGVKNWYMALLLDHFTNQVPFVALVLATPGLFRRWKKSIAVLAGGLAVIVACQLLLSWAVYELVSRYVMTKMYYKLSQPLFLINDALPLILWIGFYPEMLSRLFGISMFSREESESLRKKRSLRQRLTEPG